ncbi:MAG: metallophosphoesterase [Nitrososphaerales archaeon]
MIDEHINIAKGVSITAPWPCIYLEKEDTILASDTHLGLEDQREKIGMHIPGSIFEKILQFILTPVKALGCERIIILGDVKHEFGRPTEAEWFSVKKFVRSLRELGCEPEVVKGNHDNYIIQVLKELNVKLHDPSLRLGQYYLTHGNIDLENDFKDTNHIFMGHEHPAISIKDDVGVKHRFKAFLSGRIKDWTVTVLPSVSPLSYGNPMNEMHKLEFMTPLLRRYGINNFVPYLIEIGKAVKKFPEMTHLVTGRSFIEYSTKED